MLLYIIDILNDVNGLITIHLINLDLAGIYTWKCTLLESFYFNGCDTTEFKKSF